MLKVRLNLRKVVAIAICLAGFSFSALAQNVVIQTNEVGKSTTNDDCAYRISGICTTEDIGGVEVSQASYSGSWKLLEFENYNSFTVSVIYEFVTSGEKKTGTIVLKANEKKTTKDNYYYPTDFKLIARKLNN